MFNNDGIYIPFAPILYQDLQQDDGRLFRNIAIVRVHHDSCYLSSCDPELLFSHKILRISLFGATAVGGIPENRVSRKTVGELWDIKKLTEGVVAWAAIMVCMDGCYR